MDQDNQKIIKYYEKTAQDLKEILELQITIAKTQATLLAKLKQMSRRVNPVVFPKPQKIVIQEKIVVKVVTKYVNKPKEKLVHPDILGLEPTVKSYKEPQEKVEPPIGTEIDFGRGLCRHCGISIINEFSYNKSDEDDKHCQFCWDKHHKK